MRSRMRTTVALWVLLAGVALTGCAEEDQKASVDLDGSGSVTPEPTQDQETSDEPREGELTRSDSAAATPKEKAISEVWFSYMEEMVRMLSVPDASPIRLRQLAVAGGVDGPQRYAEDLVERDIRLAGGMVATLLEVEVKGNRATVDGCLHSSMVEVDSAGKPLEELVPWFRATNSLVWDGQVWMVDHHKLEGSAKCL